MSEFKGTKGKWHIDENNEIKHNVFSICLINRFTPTTDIFKANALLISKAPEILKELNNIVDCWEKDVFQELDIDSIRNLIKQATEL